MKPIQFDNRQPIYLQLIEQFRLALVGNQLSPGEELPSRRQVASTMGINPNTVQRAFNEMEETGWIFTEPNRPSRVTLDTDILKQMKKDFVRQAINDFVKSIESIDISHEEVSALLAEEIAKHRNDEVEKKGDSDD